ncbi:hypothetical protein KT99_07498 [Shewanella benthica KT99]|uniref:Uncharacterized protein n=1 Tax=Shewanella benthica KT99 TaxID=314608 RepID=A9DCQ4_9GAMM|nr:hypothetical protein KT99_07498 [Shewanella benthica KT99]
MNRHKKMIFIILVNGISDLHYSYNLIKESRLQNLLKMYQLIKANINIDFNFVFKA